MFRNVIWLPNLLELLTKVKCNARVKGHTGVNLGQPGVKLLRNVLWLPNLVGRTPY